MREPRRILLGVSGGIAAYKIPELVRELLRRGYEVGAVLTEAAQRFVTPEVFRTLCPGPVFTQIWESEGGRVKHIEVADWADLYLIAPATATTLARLAVGMAEEPVSLVYMATRALRVVVPAMNVNMWKSPAVQRNIEILTRDGTLVYPPESGPLACGWVGEGRLPDLLHLAEFVDQCFEPKTLTGYKLVITAGATREYLDPIRFLSNPSTGAMGFALAKIAQARGAKVWLVTGPTSLPTPPGVECIQVERAEEMLLKVEEIFQRFHPDGIIATAAVADFQPLKTAEKKIKKGERSELTVKLVPTPDILKTISLKYSPAIRIGFAAETHNLEEYAHNKLREKNLQLVVGNCISPSNPGFGEGPNAVTFFFADGTREDLPTLSKEEIARRILNLLPQLRGLATLPQETTPLLPSR